LLVVCDDNKHYAKLKMNHNAKTQQERANTHLVRVARYRTNQTRLLMTLKKLYIRTISIPVVFAHYISFYHKYGASNHKGHRKILTNQGLQPISNVYIVSKFILFLTECYKHEGKFIVQSSLLERFSSFLGTTIPVYLSNTSDNITTQIDPQLY